MVTWWIMLVMNAVFMPGIMMLAGRFMWKHAPKERNGLIGYRTARSQRSQEAWDYAQTTCGRLWAWVGAVLPAVSIVTHLPLMHAAEDVVGYAGMGVCFAEIAVMLATIPVVERKLKEKFGE